jgi:hypothetical protein
VEESMLKSSITKIIPITVERMDAIFDEFISLQGNDFYQSSVFHFKPFYLCGYFFAPGAQNLLWKTNEFSLPEQQAS